jgi:integrase
VLKVIRRVYNWHKEQGLYSGDNLTDGIKLPKYDNKVTSFISNKEALGIISYLQTYSNQYMARIVLFGMYTGRRTSEIISLKWQGDLGEDTYTVRDSKNGQSYVYPLNQKALEIIEIAPKESAYVFPNGIGNKYIHFKNQWLKLRKKLMSAGIINERYRFYDVSRHFYASTLANEGVPLYHISQLLGHSGSTMVLRYAHLSDETLRKANDLV